MVLEKREEVKKIFEDFLDDSLLRIILSNPAFKDGAGPCKALKVRVRPVMLKGGMVFQAEELTEKISPKSDERRRRILLAGTDGERF